MAPSRTRRFCNVGRKRDPLPEGMGPAPPYMRRLRRECVQLRKVGPASLGVLTGLRSARPCLAGRADWLAGRSIVGRAVQLAVRSSVPRWAAVAQLQPDTMLQNPPPHITATPLPSNILEWHYVVHDLVDCPYAGADPCVSLTPSPPACPDALRHNRAVVALLQRAVRQWLTRGPCIQGASTTASLCFRRLILTSHRPFTCSRPMVGFVWHPTLNRFWVHRRCCRCPS